MDHQSQGGLKEVTQLSLHLLLDTEAILPITYIFTMMLWTFKKNECIGELD